MDDDIRIAGKDNGKNADGENVQYAKGQCADHERKQCSIDENRQFAVVDKNSSATFQGTMDDYPNGFVIIVDKPEGWTSADAVRKIKFGLQRRFKMKKLKVGHAGTLDPLATGMLVICVGKATKVSELLQAEPKEYLASVKFGATTPSFDMEKEIDATYPFKHITSEKIQEVLKTFIGEQYQLPPIYSAKFVGGMRAYEWARLGEDVELKKAKINIYNIDFISYEAPVLKLSIKCGKGTYIRAFARDLGLALDSGAYLTELRRVSSGGFRIENALTLEGVARKFEY